MVVPLCEPKAHFRTSLVDCTELPNTQADLVLRPSIGPTLAYDEAPALYPKLHCFQGISCCQPHNKHSSLDRGR